MKSINMENSRKFWVLEHGKDCDGFYTRGFVRAFTTYEEACLKHESSCEFSDGMQYQLTDSVDEVMEYCNEYELNLADYL